MATPCLGGPPGGRQRHTDGPHQADPAPYLSVRRPRERCVTGGPTNPYGQQCPTTASHLVPCKGPMQIKDCHDLSSSPPCPFCISAAGGAIFEGLRDYLKGFEANTIAVSRSLAAIPPCDFTLPLRGSHHPSLKLRSSHPEVFQPVCQSDPLFYLMTIYFLPLARLQPQGLRAWVQEHIFATKEFTCQFAGVWGQQ